MEKYKVMDIRSIIVEYGDIIRTKVTSTTIFDDLTEDAAKEITNVLNKHLTERGEVLFRMFGYGIDN